MANDNICAYLFVSKWEERKRVESPVACVLISFTHLTTYLESIDKRDYWGLKVNAINKPNMPKQLWQTWKWWFASQANIFSVFFSSVVWGVPFHLLIKKGIPIRLAFIFLRKKINSYHMHLVKWRRTFVIFMVKLILQMTIPFLSGSLVNWVNATSRVLGILSQGFQVIQSCNLNHFVRWWSQHKWKNNISVWLHYGVLEQR